MDRQDARETARMLYTLYLMDPQKAADYLRGLVEDAYKDGFDAALDTDRRINKRDRHIRLLRFRGEEI